MSRSGAIWVVPGLVLIVAASGCGGGAGNTKTVTVVETTAASATTARSEKAKATPLTTKAPSLTSCGKLQGESLEARGITCARASALAGALNIEGTSPKGWTCAGTAIVCWKGSPSDSSAPLEFSLLPAPGPATSCPSGEAPVGSAGACAPKPATCEYVQGVRLSLSLSSIDCTTAQHILYSYFQENNGGTMQTHIEVAVLNPARAASDFWVCDGTINTSGQCYNRTAIRSHEAIRPAFGWTP